MEGLGALKLQAFRKGEVIMEEIEIKITEEEWNEKGFELLNKYSLADIIDYFAFVEMPKIQKAAAERKKKGAIKDDFGLKKGKND